MPGSGVCKEDCDGSAIFVDKLPTQRPTPSPESSDLAQIIALAVGEEPAVVTPAPTLTPTQERVEDLLVTSAMIVSEEFGTFPGNFANSYLW